MRGVTAKKLRRQIVGDHQKVSLYVINETTGSIERNDKYKEYRQAKKAIRRMG